MFIIVLFYAIIASVYTIGKQVVMYGSPFFLTAIRITPAGLFFLGYQYFKNRKMSFPKKEDWHLIAAYSFGVFIMDSFRFIGLQYIPSSNAALVATTAPFMATFMSYYWFKEHITLKKCAVLGLGFCGVLPIVISHMHTSNIPLSNALLAYAAIGASTFMVVVSGILSKFLIQKKGYPFFTILGTVMTFGGLIGLSASVLFDTWDPTPLIKPWEALPLIGFLIATHSLISYPLYSYLVQIYPVTLVSFAQLMTPFFAALFGYLFFGEQIGLIFFGSLTILSIALFLFHKEEKNEGLIKE